MAAILSQHVVRIWTAPYRLAPRQSLNSRSGTNSAEPRSGTLLRIEFDSGAIGFADLHPWVELGDDALDVQLARLRNGHLTPLTRRSLALADADADARASGASVFDGLSVPDSHFLVTALTTTISGQLDAARKRGFDTIKLKIGRDLMRERNALIAHADALTGLNLRLDANATPDYADILAFFDRLPEALRRQIEFVEDPCPYRPDDWARLAHRVPIALDRAGGSDLQLDRPTLIAGGITHLVCKPAVQDVEPFVRTARNTPCHIVVTSYMDHPIGQLGAALAAGRLHRRLARHGLSHRLATAGLLSQTVYEPNEFSHHWARAPGPQFTPPAGTGIGFDTLLAQQAWKELI